MIDLEALKVGDMQTEYGVEIVFTDGKKDWVDPVIDGGVSESADEYLICNGAFTYPYKKSDVAELRRYELCPKCHRAVENCRCSEIGEERNA